MVLTIILILALVVVFIVNVVYAVILCLELEYGIPEQLGDLSKLGWFIFLVPLLPANLIFFGGYLLLRACTKSGLEELTEEFKDLFEEDNNEKQ